MILSFLCTEIQFAMRGKGKNLSSHKSGNSGEGPAGIVIRGTPYREISPDELDSTVATVRAMLDNTDSLIWSVDTECRYLYGNSAFLSNFQRWTGHLLVPGEVAPDWLPEGMQEKWRGYYRQGLSGVSFTTMSSARTGLSLNYMRYSFSPVRNRAGEVTGLAITGTEVTDLMQMQKGLLRTGVMLQEAQSVAKLGNWEYDVKLARPEWSDEVLMIFGLPRQTGEPKWDSHLNRIHPDDLLQFENAIMKAYSEGTPFDLIFRLQIPGEEIKWTRAIGKAEKDRHGTVTRLYGTVQDVSEQKAAERELARSEQRYRNLFEKSVVPIWEEDCSALKRYLDGLRKRGVKDFRKYFTKYPERAAKCVSMVKIKDLNRTSIQFFGVNEKSDLETGLEHFFTDESVKCFVEEVIAFAEGKREFDTDIPLKMPGGKERYVHLKLHVVPDEGDTMSQVLVSWIDITDRIKYEQGLKRTGETLRRLNMHIEEAREKERSQIAMNLHDDLGQQLTAMRMNLSWLRKRIGVQSALVSDKLDEVELIIENSIGTVQKISSELRPAILYDLGLKDAVEWHMKQNLGPAGIKGTFRLAPRDLKIDEKSSIVLFRIIQEALTNIIRHSGAEKADVTIMKSPSHIELVIRDNGKGIDDDAVNDPKSFGITSIKERIKNISGEFTITGEKGRGTVLRVKIPSVKKQF